MNSPDIILDRLATHKGADDLNSYVTSSLRYIALPFTAWPR